MFQLMQTYARLHSWSLRNELDAELRAFDDYSGVGEMSTSSTFYEKLEQACSDDYWIEVSLSV